MPTLLNVTSEYIDKQGLNINVVFKPFPPLTLHAQQTMATCPVALVHKTKPEETQTVIENISSL